MFLILEKEDFYTYHLRYETDDFDIALKFFNAFRFKYQDKVFILVEDCSK